MMTARHLSAVDRAAPGLVSMLYVVGSTALGDFQPGHSDIDVVTVLSRDPSPDDLHALATTHADLESIDGAPHYDGVYVTREDLANPPDDGRPVPFVVNGEFRVGQPCGELGPVLWLTLARYGLAVRGPAAATLGLRADPTRLREWNLGNLRSYWQPLAEQTLTLLDNTPTDGAMSSEAISDGATSDGAASVGALSQAELAQGVAWLALGPPRLHHTIVTGDVISKTAAATHVATYFPAWTDLAARAARWRGGAEIVFTLDDARQAAALALAVVAEGRA